MNSAVMSNVTYELHSLGWKAFQQLCVSITAEIWGQTVQAFSDTKDGGRDGAFHGSWKSGSKILEGSFTVQCKFTAKKSSSLSISDLTDELKKAKRLAGRGLADNYFLFTNTILTGTSEELVREAFLKIENIKSFHIYGVERISQIINESPRLRMLVPRIYGLGDLSHIMDERAYAQAQEILSSLGDELAKFVITEAYQNSAKALIEHGFVILLGEPACGKSTIAAALAVAALDEFNCSTIKVRDANDFVKHSNPNEGKQFFWIDDAFGATQIDWQSTFEWNRVLPHIQAAIKRGAKVVFTSRDYIYRSARSVLKESALPLLTESQVIIEVQKITKEEREQILYNHIKLGTQSQTYKRDIKPYLPQVVENAMFTPEISRRLGNPAFTKKLQLNSYSIQKFVENPMELLMEVIRTLDSSSRAAIALVFMRGGDLQSPLSLTEDENNSIILMGGSMSSLIPALESLNGSLLISVKSEGKFSWKFKHPTIRDAFAELLSQSRELMDLYLAGTPMPQLFTEVSCGDVGLEGVKVIVPNDRFDIVLARIKLLASKREYKTSILRFLAKRCSKGFLETYIAQNPDFISSLRIYSYIEYLAETFMVAKLHELDLITEEFRLKTVQEIHRLAIDTPDSGFTNPDIRKILTDNEYQSIVDDLHNYLLPGLSDRVEDWKSNYDDEGDPDGHFSPLITTLRELKSVFEENDQSLKLIDNGLAHLDRVIEDIKMEMPNQENPHDDYRNHKSNISTAISSRSIFDDVDL
jgi:energy-coupling factor transporter ATP-binding protein EcfA2